MKIVGVGVVQYARKLSRPLAFFFKLGNY
jgi:hypothetical protein